MGEAAAAAAAAAAATSAKEQRQHSLSSSPPALHASSVALASTVATVLTKSFLHPLDTVKCRLQSSSSRSLGRAWRDYSGRWGPTYLYGGLPVKLLFYVPYQAIYMTTYNTVRDSLKPADTSAENRASFLARTVISASGAELASCVARVPMETLKMRIQAAVVPDTRAALQQIRRHGIAACARLVLPQTLLHDIPYSAIQWICYETMRPWARQLMESRRLDQEPNRASRFRGYAHDFVRTFFSGGFSALIASTVTVPLDTIRTRVVVAAAADPSTTVRRVVRDTYRLGGVRIFFRGAVVRVLWVTTNMAVYFPLYEALKVEFLRRQETRAAVSSS
ncbi:mitochondrial carrier protein [Trypanosoma grayi]|uniref:mitochondrial carrier protein n=1 Tax=Trypanosoma grayi TaxID=71804 RepID=UPI0004F41BC5|nr:mitochondrial carrier protein [Trypanosoma grayi]KEG14451.1 mitochondrial carrier protein [Trypanosoma grayi]